MNVTVIVAARMGSSRLPGKVMRPLGDLPMLEFLLLRLQRSHLADKEVLATTEKPEDDSLVSLAERIGVPVYRGSERDVTGRYLDAADWAGAEYVARVTGDCPLVDAKIVDDVIEWGNGLSPFDLLTTKGHYPVGLDVEIFSVEKLRNRAKRGLLDEEDREHVTLHFYKHPDLFRVVTIEPPEALSLVEGVFTVDTESDYQRMRGIVRDGGDVEVPTEKLLERMRSDADDLFETVGAHHA
ncbi:MAG: acylneuraminate cytidylyltransferase [bacterium]